jgi:hypothetical protein
MEPGETAIPRQWLGNASTVVNQQATIEEEDSHR